jgi:uncharacterized protein (TIGR04255 family)
MTIENFPNLSKPPIKEAVLGVIVNEELSDKYGRFSEDEPYKSIFPSKKEMRRVEFQFQAGSDGVNHGHSDRSYGYEYQSTDTHTLVRFSPDEFSYHAVNEYPGGDDFRDNSIKIFNVYKNLRKDTFIKRVGLRFINFMAFPTNGEVSQYFNVYIQKDGGGLIMSNQKFYFETFFEDIGCKALVNFSIERSDEKNLSVIWDMDVSVENSDDLNTEEGFESAIVKLRTAKNRLFFESVKEKMWEQYQ